MAILDAIFAILFVPLSALAISLMIFLIFFNEKK